MRCIDSLVNSATIILPMNTELTIEDIFIAKKMRIFNYILIKLVSKQVIEIYISKCLFIWKHKKTTLDITYKKWDRTHFGCIMHTTISVQHVAYKNFSHCWSIQDLKWSTWPSKRMREKLLAIHLVLIFPKVWIL